MPRSVPPSLIALAAALALAGCNRAPQITDNAMVNEAGAATVNDAAFNDAAPLVEDVGEETTPAVAVVAVPAVPKGAAPADAAPIAGAAAIEEEIRAGRGVERIRFGEGWAWTRGGRILRTAGRDGQNAAYFHDGDDKPFFVQRGSRAFAYQGDRAVRVYDGKGGARAPDADRTREAADAAREARDQRDRADAARRNAGRDRGHEPAATPTPTPSPSPSPTPAPGRRGGRDWHPAPTPSPTATPASRWRQPHRTPGERVNPGG